MKSESNRTAAAPSLPLVGDVELVCVYLRDERDWFGPATEFSHGTPRRAEKGWNIIISSAANWKSSWVDCWVVMPEEGPFQVMGYGND